MTDLREGLVTVFVAGVLNAALIARIGSSQPRSEGAFLARVHAATLLRAVATVEAAVTGVIEEHDFVYPDEGESARRA